MKLIELFSGIGGFTKGLQYAGFEIEEHYFSEIDKHAIANYKYNFPHAKYIGDVKSIQSGDFTGIDIITFGSPCQDFSLAGKRKGLEGSRSSLIQHAIDLVTDVRPSVFIWENVKGAFSSNSGADFWAILQAFANIGGYRLEWQLLNTKWVLPQNRERIYLIGHLDGRSKPGVFPIGEGDSLYFGHGKNQKKIYTNNRTALIQQARQYASWNGDFIKVKSATKIGYEKACHGDSINLSLPNSETRRGRVGKGVAQTLDTQCNQSVYYESDIRRLTEIECERLQGFPDDWTKYGFYEKQVWINKKEGTFEIVEGVKEIPKTQRYKQCGNAVTATIVMQIGIKLKNLIT
ncbi:DNA (cytosine-5-)-methyltransferase [Elizabethkingia miricola]|nr:DNA (cytosine-5-)-methyltransferase [Elizabethkingia miricola]